MSTVLACIGAGAAAGGEEIAFMVLDSKGLAQWRGPMGLCYKSTHRLGTNEIESALVLNSKLVAEAAVGEDAKKMAKELRDWVAKEIGPIAKPKDIRFGDNLPKTRSGKIMRRLLRSIAKGEPITQDISTLENPQILDQLKENL
jgi:acetyl-CoA synthetase